MVAPIAVEYSCVPVRSWKSGLTKQPSWVAQPAYGVTEAERSSFTRSPRISARPVPPSIASSPVPPIRMLSPPLPYSMSLAPLSGCCVWIVRSRSVVWISCGSVGSGLVVSRGPETSWVTEPWSPITTLS